MATLFAKVNVFKVRNDSKFSNIDCKTLKKILQKNNIDALICEHGDGWLIRIDCYAREVLNNEDYCLIGKFDRIPYNLNFTVSHEKFPDPANDEEREHKRKREGKQKPQGGFGCDEETQETIPNIPTTDLPEETKELPEKYDPKTIAVYGVPLNLDIDELMLYFENPKRGGPIQHCDDSNRKEIKITFESSAVASAVLKKKNHNFDENNIRISLYKPPEIEKKQVIISDIKPKIKVDTMKNFLEVKIKLDVKHVKKIKDGLFLVQLEKEIDFDVLQTNLQQETKLFLSDSYPKVHEIQVTTKVLVINHGDKMTKENVKRFFYDHTQPEDFVNIKELTAKQFVITFKDSELAKKTCQRNIPDFEINLYSDYAISDETCKEIALKSSFWLKFIMDYKNVLEDELKDYGNLDLSNSVGNVLKIIFDKNNEEEEEIKRRVDAFLEIIFEEQVLIPVKLFDKVTEIPMANTQAKIYFDKENSTAHIFSFDKSTSLECQKEISNYIEQQYTKTEQEELDVYKIVLLFSDFFPSKIFPKYKNVNITLNGSNIIKFHGASSDVTEIISEMYKYLANIKFTPIQLSKNYDKIINKPEVKKYLYEKLSKKCHCSWEIHSDNQLYLYTFQTANADLAKKILKNSIVELNFYLNGPKLSILKQDKWKNFLEQQSKKYVGHFYIEIQKGKLVIVTTDKTAPKIKEDFEKFFDTHAIYRNTLKLKSGIYTFLMRFESSAILDFTKTYKQLEIQFENDQTIHILGTKEVSEEALKFLKKLSGSIIEQKETFPHFGFKKFLKSEISETVFEKISKKNKCIILNKEDASLEKNSIHQIKYKNCEIILQLKDITELDVDAIVNPANKELKHVGGLSLAIVKKGGEIIQQESDDLIRNLGHPLNEGMVKVTSAGQLRCTYIFHAVGPIWKDGNNYEREFLSEAVTNILEAAKMKNCTSIAIPAISTGTLKFPVDIATEIIMKNIKEYFDDNDDIKLKSIYLISLKNNVITAFRNQLNLKFPQVLKKTNPGPKPKKSGKKSQTEIIIEYGLLNQMKCDVIVNTTNENMNLSSGQISKAILKDAGPKLQEACDKISPLYKFDIAVTDAYNLSCKTVFHIFLPYWGDSSAQLIRTCIHNCLMKADEQSYSHIAFPVFGTGNLGYPLDIVANEMVTTISEYISSKNTALQKVSIVIYPGKADMYQAFENAKDMTSGTSVSRTPTYQPNVSETTTTPTLSQQGDSLEMDIKGIKLVVKKGNIVEQDTDCIVHGTNQQFTIRGAISQVLLNKIGHQFTTDCKSKVNEMISNHYILTPGHSLSAKWILHVNIEGIKKCAKKVFQFCLQAAEDNRLTSLALPPIGTGGMNCSVQYISDSFMQSLQEFAKSSPQHLKTVILVVFEQSIFAEFCQKIGSKQNTFKLPTPTGLWNRLTRTVGNTEKFVPKKIEQSAVELFIYAKEQSTIKKVKSEIDTKYTSDYLQKKTIKENIIRNFTSLQIQEISELQNKYDAKIEFNNSSIDVSGYNEDVTAVIEHIQNMLLRFLRKIKDAEITEKCVQWSYMTMENNKAVMKPYPTDINHELEIAYEKKQKIMKKSVRDGMLVFDFSDKENMVEYHEHNKANTTKIYRKDLTKSDISLPIEWQLMENEDYLKVELKPGAEYDTVKLKFPTNFTIVKIERIQNKSLYIQYQAQLQKMNILNPTNTQNETKDLWHGTSESVTEKINKSGFDRGYCGKNATAYGQGVYFARDPQYSLSNTYSPPNNLGLKHMYLCNVLTGIYCKGDSSMKVLPANPNMSDRPYDSAVNDINNPTMFITFHDASAYPAYLITCQ